jgi:hypothetical protein
VHVQSSQYHRIYYVLFGPHCFVQTINLVVFNRRKQVSLRDPFDKEKIGFELDFLDVVFGYKVLHFLNKLKEINLSTIFKGLLEMGMVV